MWSVPKRKFTHCFWGLEFINNSMAVKNFHTNHKAWPTKIWKYWWTAIALTPFLSVLWTEWLHLYALVVFHLEAWALPALLLSLPVAYRPLPSLPNFLRPQLLIKAQCWLLSPPSTVSPRLPSALFLLLCVHLFHTYLLYFHAHKPPPLFSIGMLYVFSKDASRHLLGIQMNKCSTILVPTWHFVWYIYFLHFWDYSLSRAFLSSLSLLHTLLYTTLRYLSNSWPLFSH